MIVGHRGPEGEIQREGEFVQAICPTGSTPLVCVAVTRIKDEDGVLMDAPDGKRGVFELWDLNCVQKIDDPEKSLRLMEGGDFDD